MLDLFDFNQTKVAGGETRKHGFGSPKACRVTEIAAPYWDEQQVIARAPIMPLPVGIEGEGLSAEFFSPSD